MALKLDATLVSKAVSAIFEYEDKKIREKGKRAVAKPILAQVQLKSTTKKAITRPIRVKVPHSLVTDEEDEYSVCLFCKNEEKASIDAHLAKNPVLGLSKVLSIGEVKKSFSATKEKKSLIAEYSHYICDSSILSKIHKLLGNSFAERTNCPIQVSFKTPAEIDGALAKVLSSSYMHIKGKTVSIRLGLTSMSEEEVQENTLEGLDFAISKFKGSWKDVHSIHLKTADSPSLPIYSKEPSEVLKYVKLKANVVDERFTAIIENSSSNISSSNLNSNAVKSLSSLTAINSKKRVGEVEAVETISSTDRPRAIKRIRSSTVTRS